MDPLPEDPDRDELQDILDHGARLNALFAQMTTQQEWVNFVADLQGRKAHDDWDAYQVESLRTLGRDIGQQEHYEKRIEQYLTERGYCNEDTDEY